MRKRLAGAIKGRQVQSWEVREHSDGKRVVYVRFAPKEPTLTVNVKGEEWKSGKVETTMKLNIDWYGLLRAVIKAVCPFIAGAAGGLIAKSTVGGIGANFFA